MFCSVIAPLSQDAIILAEEKLIGDCDYQIRKIVMSNESADEKIRLLKEIKVTGYENCNCRGRRAAAQKILDASVTYAINKIIKEANG